MFPKILVATDLSAASDRVIEAMGGIKSLGTEEVRLLYCVNLRGARELAPQLLKMAEPALVRQAEALSEMGYRVESDMVIGLPHREINHQAEEHDCSLVVVGSHGETGTSEIKLGSVADAVLHSMTRPTLLVRLTFDMQDEREVCELVRCDFLGNILFPTDFSENAEYAFDFVKRIVERGAKAVTLLHAQNIDAVERHLRSKAEIREMDEADSKRLDPLLKELTERGVPEVHTDVRHGSPKKVISEATGEGVSLVIMGSQGRGRVAEFFLGSVGNEVARHSKVPVLLIPVP
jgi:nucleotide-binding universal stress UspA family protein